MGKMDGIMYLVAVTQMKASNANDDALHGAEKQRELVKKQQTLRAVTQRFEELVRDKVVTGGAGGDQEKIAEMYQSLNADNVTQNPLSYNYTFEGAGETSSPDVDWQKRNQEKVDGIRKDLDGAMKDLEAEDRLGNFEIQRLMSTFNQMETLSSNVQKKADDTASGQQQKIG
jgi:hypothetical protein